MIMELCVGVEYMNFRATCKQCLLAAPLIKWSNETSLRRLQTHSPVSPLLMVVDTRRGIITFTDPLLGDNYFLKNSKVLSDEHDRLCYSRFGWLLFWKRDLNCLVFFNPFTNDLWELPETEHDLENLCFSAPPTSLDCMVVGFTTECVYILYVNQKRTWRGLRFDPDLPPVCFSGFYGRDLYVSCEQGKLFVITNIGKKDQSLEAVEAEAPKGYCRSRTQYFITNCDEHTLLVSVGECGEAVEIFKHNEYEEKWEKIDSLGKHTIYICATTWFCIEAKEPKMENKIFFPRLHKKNKRVVFYSLDTCRYHTFDAQNFQGEHLEDFFGTTHHVSLNVWIEPSWS
ncbi:hypothetical protein CTI12_AA529580 [Artemisia annua]|uniref:KIB1-4 beta-propeller domain-containing protein n=1 Tax=Artemisia annua TaxID=35608 RepID=A0A2U1L514_ARTAN|nr:hypothetical protein CTI12_AA529580 [Artemisia annua]